MLVIIDTNALIYAVENKIDIFTMLKGNAIIIPNLVLEELQIISKSAKKASDKKAAFIALKILENISFETVELKGHTDDAILAFARDEGASVLTNDNAFKKKLKEANVPILELRQKKYVKQA